MTPTWQSADGAVRLFLGDCLQVLPTLEPGSVDAVVTDPPWGIGIGSGTINRKRGKSLYASSTFEDSEEYVREVCVPAIICALEKSGGRGLVTSGVPCMSFYPRPQTVGGFYQPAAVGMSHWGFASFNPVLFYGKDPRAGKGQSAVMTTLTTRASNITHPCAKPISAMLWMVVKASLSEDIILDPFMGSGTTIIAAIRTGRKAIGIEIDERYFAIAVARIERELSQPRLPGM
jgi:site-specific DNA-methyltransferase (adenine-specific)